MIPESLSPDIPASERYVYGRLRATLPESWTVIHGRRFLIPRDVGGSVQEGELDFLVLDPQRGAIGLEVKGGGVQRTREGWYSVDRSGERHSIRDPGKQASAAAHAIYRFLKSSKAFGGLKHRCGVSWGVVLPDVDVRDSLGPDLPRSVVIDRGDFADLPRAINRIFEAQRVDGPPLSAAAGRALTGVLLPTCRLIPSMAARFQQEGDALIRLTDEQTDILDMLEANRRVAIEGAAGTGKTLLALEKARRLAAGEKRTLLLCFNRPLADELAKSASGFEVNTFHGLCHAKADLAQLRFSVPKGGRQRPFWEDEAPLLLMEALEARPEDRYDAIVVDEGQDFRVSWWSAIDELFKDGDRGTLYVFFDPNQNIYGGGPPAALGVAPTKLVFNCRNTSRIAAYSGNLVGASIRVRPGAPTGATVSEIDCTSDADMVDHVRKALHQLVVDEKVACDRIIVLSTHAPGNSVLARNRRLGNVQLVPPDSERRPMTVRFTSLQRFKGLESDVVILVDVRDGHSTSSPSHLYVGTSRARHLLIMMKHAAFDGSGHSSK